MPDLAVEVDTQALTNSVLGTQVDTQALSNQVQSAQVDTQALTAIKQPVLVDSVVFSGAFTSASVLVDTKAQRTGVPVSMQVDTKTSVRASLGLNIDSQVLNFASDSLLIDSQVATRVSIPVQVDTFAKVRSSKNLVLQVDTFVSQTLVSTPIVVDTIAIPVGKVFNSIFLNYHYQYPIIES